MNLPNVLTISRLVSIPVLMVLLGVRFPNHDQIAAAVFLAASLTDTLDGNLARRRGQVTELGKFLDPLADKVFILSVLIALVQEGALAAWIVVVVFSRELLITVLRSLSASQGHVIAATPFGKTKTVLQVAAVLLLILARPYPVLRLPAAIAVALAVVFTVLSGLDYLWRFRSVWWQAERDTAGAGSAAAPPAAGDRTEAGEPPPDASAGALARRLHDRLRADRLTIAVAESCTGGMLAAAITDQPGSSAYFKGGIIAYSNEIKQALLGVPGELLARYGAVSEEVARAMAEGARSRLDVDLAVSITGIAGPDADGTDKPVGLTHLWLADARGGRGLRFVFRGDRGGNRCQAVTAALGLLLQGVEAS